MVAELETGHVGSDRLIQRIQPLQVCVEVASSPTGQSDVMSLDGLPRLDCDFFRVIYCDNSRDHLMCLTYINGNMYPAGTRSYFGQKL